MSTTPPGSPSPRRRLTISLDVTTVLLGMAVTVLLLLVLVVVVGVLRNTVDLTNLASVVAVLLGGIVSGVTIAARGQKKDDGPS